MARARGLVGHFSSSSQASEALSNVQRRAPGKSLVVIQDVRTRWWSTWKMIQRLRVLKHYFSIMVDEGALDPSINLTNDEWDLLAEIEEILEPFMLIQRLLEGQKYVTLSFVPYLITAVRKNLTEMSVSARSSEVRGLCNKMLVHPVNGMNTYWGSGDIDTLFEEINEIGRGNRQKGLPRNTLLAAALDPRSKKLKGMGANDKNKIWNELRKRMRAVHEAREPVEQRVVNLDEDDAVEVRVPVKNPLAELYKGIGDDSEDEEAKNGGDEEDRVDTMINIELEYYKSLKTLDITEGTTENGEEVFSNPLLWWKMQQKMLPLLSTLARRILCIPATSAPSERVFSTAGLTIAKCRASLQPQNASDLIFLPFAEEIELRQKQK